MVQQEVEQGREGALEVDGQEDERVEGPLALGEQEGKRSQKLEASCQVEEEVMDEVEVL